MGRVLELKEVNSFSEYHDSLEQGHGKIAKSYDVYEGESRISHDIHTVCSFTDETYLACKKVGLLSRETDNNERYVMN